MEFLGQALRLKTLYRPRMEAMLEALDKHLKGAKWSRPDGGFFISATLPGNVDGKAVRENAKNFGIVLSDGRGFFPDCSGEIREASLLCTHTRGDRTGNQETEKDY